MSDTFTVSGPPNAFPEGTPVGTIVEGRIVNREKVQSTEMGTGKPLVWDNGEPRIEWVITLEAADGDQRRLFAKGNMLKAIKAAVVTAGSGSLEHGAYLKVTRTGQEKPKSAGFKGAWTYEAVYTKPGPAAAGDDLF